MSLGTFAFSWFAFGLFLTASASAQIPVPTVPSEPKGMVSLFNGRDLTGWDGDPRLWSVKDGTIRGETTAEKNTKENTFLIWKGGEIGDFDLRLSFRIVTGNSGVQYRSKRLPEKDGNRWMISGYQAEIEDLPGKVGFSYQERERGHLAEVGEKTFIGDDGKPKVVGSLGYQYEIARTYKKSDWNDYVIIFRGNHLQQYVNRIQTTDVIDNDPNNAPKKGLLALQLHCGDPMWVEFKNLRLKQFSESRE